VLKNKNAVCPECRFVMAAEKHRASIQSKAVAVAAAAAAVAAANAGVAAAVATDEDAAVDSQTSFQ
jgi:hypothetical protein